MIKKGWILVKLIILLFLVGYTFYVYFTVPEDEDMPGVYRLFTLVFGFIVLYGVSGAIKIIDLVIIQVERSKNHNIEVKK